ncbi:MAG: hypothetical protein WCI88_14010, partial [Chloroflexota bacterium]
MNEEIPLRKLREILSLYGIAVLNDPRRLASLMRDFFGDYKREIYILTTSLYNHVPDELLTLDKTIPAEIGLSRMVERLVNECAMSDEAARWGVQTWAQALEVIKRPILETRPRSETPPLEIKVSSPIKMPPPKPGQRAYSATAPRS